MRYSTLPLTEKPVNIIVKGPANRRSFVTKINTKQVNHTLGYDINQALGAIIFAGSTY